MNRDPGAEAGISREICMKYTASDAQWPLFTNMD